MTPELRKQRLWETTRATLWLLLVSSAFLILIQFAKRTFTTDYNLGAFGGLATGALAPIVSQLSDPSVLIALTAATIIAVTAFKVRRTLMVMVNREGHETRAAYEVSLFPNTRASDAI